MDSCLDLVLRALPVAMELHYFIFQGIVKYNAGPANTPKGHVIGSFGPTTAQRMDGYVPSFMAAGGGAHRARSHREREFIVIDDKGNSL
jgi:tartrate dehydratase beta subunit/fumarate hydratase class I family protein